jgi:hypothetical protein
MSVRMSMRIAGFSKSGPSLLEQARAMEASGGFKNMAGGNARASLRDAGHRPTSFRPVDLTYLSFSCIDNANYFVWFFERTALKLCFLPLQTSRSI